MAIQLRDVLHSGARRRVVGSIATLLLATGILVTVQSAAFADTMVSFDDLSPGAVVSSQYAAQGITFDQSPSGPAGYQPRVIKDQGATHSSPNALDIEQMGSCDTGGNRVGLWAPFRPAH